jgi:hypothetical protein
LFRRIGNLHQIGGLSAEASAEREGTETQMWQRATSNDESKEREQRLINRANGPAFAISNADAGQR